MDVKARMTKVDFSHLSNVKDSLLDRLLMQQREQIAQRHIGLRRDEMDLDELDMVIAAKGRMLKQNKNDKK